MRERSDLLPCLKTRACKWLFYISVTFLAFAVVFTIIILSVILFSQPQPTFVPNLSLEFPNGNCTFDILVFLSDKGTLIQRKSAYGRNITFIPISFPYTAKIYIDWFIVTNKYYPENERLQIISRCQWDFISITVGHLTNPSKQFKKRLPINSISDLKIYQFKHNDKPSFYGQSEIYSSLPDQGAIRLYLEDFPTV